MKIYQFIKYNHETNINHFYSVIKTNAVLCFDFEDGIEYPFDPLKSAKLKNDSRIYFKNIYEKIQTMSKPVKIGVRINRINKLELEKDIYMLEKMKIYSVFLPKVHHPSQIIEIIDAFTKYNIQYTELIPIIETKDGLSNIDLILGNSSSRIQCIAFGHCDYNLSLNTFPFFHQDSIEYWKWVNKLLDHIRGKNISFINSPYLKLDNETFFRAMLGHLREISGNYYGQITLTSRQSAICSEQNIIKNEDFTHLINNILCLYSPANFKQSLILMYEKDKNGYGLAKYEDTLISPQEYLIAKNRLDAESEKSVKFAFVGGCFLVQHDILFEDHFHQIFKRKIESENNFDAQIDIIRYNRLDKVMDKIAHTNMLRENDVIFFSVRPEPYLGMIKFWTRSYNSQGKVKHSINAVALNLNKPYDNDFSLTSGEYRYKFKKNRSRLYKMLIAANYLVGILFGNQRRALKLFGELLIEIDGYCNENNIKLIIMGPSLRSNTVCEPLLCRKLDKYVRITSSEITYISGLDTTTQHGTELFQSNGIHVNEEYHRLIGERLFDQWISFNN